MNNLTISGRLTADPITNEIGGKTLTKFSVVENYTQKGQKIANYFECEAWAKTGDIVARYWKKGKPINVIGNIRTSYWEKDGVQRSKQFVAVREVEFVERDNEGVTVEPLKHNNTFPEIDAMLDDQF
jgi:single-strand DNA-binding protein